MIDRAAIAVILLAAGRSERFGRDKLLASLGGTPVAIAAARGLAELRTGWRIAICRDTGPLDRDLTALGFDILVNPDPARGLSSSLALGIERAEAVGAKAVLVALADMPFVSAGHWAALIAAFDPPAVPIVASDRAGVPMPPALFDGAFFTRLRSAEGDKGARDVIRGARLVAADPHELHDIDRPEDLP